MAVITPQTDIYLLKVPLEISDMNQLTFANKQAQYNYFNSLPKLQAGDYTYQRKDGTLRFAGQFDDLLNYNYCMYRNDAYSDKWFYAFITDMEYSSDNMTKITLKTDVWQTWQFDLTFKPCLIDREHVNDDSVGLHTLPEELELGEMVANGNPSNFGGAASDPLNNKYYTIIEVSQVENKGSDGTISYSWVSGSHDLTPAVNGIDRGTIPLIIGGTFAGHTSGVIRTVDQVTHLYDNSGLGSSIVNIYVLPTDLVPGFNEIELTSTPSNGTTITLDGIGIPTSTSGTENITTATFSRPTTLNGYMPKCKKLLTYPFCYFNISNNAGTQLPYRYEDFGSNISFKVEGTFGASGSTKAIPQNYLNITTDRNALDYSITGPKFPICSWNSDSYTNWLTQNAVNMEVQWKSNIIGGLLGVASSSFGGGMQSKAGGLGFAAGAGAGAVSGGIEMAGTLIDTARQQHLAKTAANMTSDQVKGNLNAGDFVWAKYRSPFTYIPMSIKAEYARCADEFLNQFGYKCNRVKVPNITGRRNWNYVKTVGCYIDGDIPQADMQEIKTMFDRGITLWHNPLFFGNYGADNDII